MVSLPFHLIIFSGNKYDLSKKMDSKLTTDTPSSLYLTAPSQKKTTKKFLSNDSFMDLNAPSDTDDETLPLNDDLENPQDNLFTDTENPIDIDPDATEDFTFLFKKEKIQSHSNLSI